MLSKKYEIVIICQNVTNENVIELSNRNVDKVIQCNELPKLTYYSGGPKILSRTIISDLIKLRKRIDNLKKIIKKIDFDICIIYSLVLAPAIKSITNDSSKILYIHETFKRNIISRLIQKFISKNFSGLLAISQSELDFFKGDLVKRLIADVYLPKKINTEHPTTKNILYLGGGDTIKGFYHVMKLSKKLPKGWTILFLGDFKPNPKINFLLHPWLKFKFAYYSRFINSKTIEKIGYIQNIGEMELNLLFWIESFNNVWKLAGVPVLNFTWDHDLLDYLGRSKYQTNFIPIKCKDKARDLSHDGPLFHRETAEKIKKLLTQSNFTDKI
jgi:hypothetical protein